MAEDKVGKKPNRYAELLERVFFDHWKAGLGEFEFARSEIEAAAAKSGVVLPKNQGDLVYSFRYRTGLPKRIAETQPRGKQWIVEGAGRSRYRFKLVSSNQIAPSAALAAIEVPDATPEIIRLHALNDEQALLAVVRYNRLIDIFTGLATYSLQNHLRTTVKGTGQIEIDELYIGIDKHGGHHVIPVQAKVGRDRIGGVQTAQDVRFASQKFPGFRCRPIAIKALPDGDIALLELVLRDEEVSIADEKRYRLVSAKSLDRDAIVKYRD